MSKQRDNEVNPINFANGTIGNFNGNTFLDIDNITTGSASVNFGGAVDISSGTITLSTGSIDFNGNVITDGLEILFNDANGLVTFNRNNISDDSIGNAGVDNIAEKSNVYLIGSGPYQFPFNKINSDIEYTSQICSPNGTPCNSDEAMTLAGETLNPDE